MGDDFAQPTWTINVFATIARVRHERVKLLELTARQGTAAALRLVGKRDHVTSDY